MKMEIQLNRRRPIHVKVAKIMVELEAVKDPKRFEEDSYCSILESASVVYNFKAEMKHFGDSSLVGDENPKKAMVTVFKSLNDNGEDEICEPHNVGQSEHNCKSIIGLVKAEKQYQINESDGSG